MHYKKITISNIPWLVPILTDSLDIPNTFPKDEPIYNPKDRRKKPRGSFWYLEGFGLLEENFNGLTLVDIGSGTGNLDKIAKNTNKLIRIDSLYEQKSITEKILSDSEEKGKYEFNPSSCFNINLESHIADLVLENFGTFHYLQHMIFGIERRYAEHDVNEILQSANNDDLVNYQRQLLYLFKSILEKIRITKPGGKIYLGPFDEEETYSMLIEPSFNNLEKRGYFSVNIETVSARKNIILSVNESPKIIQKS